MKKILLILLISTLYGCSKDLEQLSKIETEQIAATKSVSDFKESKFGSPMVLGEKVENPYSVTSLRKASEKMRSIATNQIIPTHYYVRFLPKDNHEYSLLMKNVQFFPFPLDRKIVESGSFYRDPDPANEGKRFSWQYAVVSVNDELPDVPYEILDEMCMPENGEGQTMTRGIGGGGNPIGPPGPTQNNKVVIRVWDSVLKQYIPLQGLSVNVINTALGQSLTYGVTDATGTAIMSKYYTVTKDIYYNIFWSDGKESKWFLTDGNDNQLFYNVKALVGVTNIDIQSSSTTVVVEQLLGTIHRAAYRTYYKTNSNLLPPAHEDAIQIAYRDEYSSDYVGRCFGYWPEVSFVNVEIMGRTASGLLPPTRNVFRTTVHELGHMNHAINSGRYTEAFTSEPIIVESWASAVEKCLTDLEYAYYGYSSSRTESLLYRDPEIPAGPTSMRTFIVPNSFNRQNWPFSWSYSEGSAYIEFLPYSPLFIDLIDNENQRDYYYSKGMQNNWQNPNNYMYKEYPKDNVKDFTIGELQNLLKTTNTLEELRNNVKRLSNLHGNSTTAIDNLFAKFVEHWRKYNPTSGAAGCNPQGSGGCVLVDKFEDIPE